MTSPAFDSSTLTKDLLASIVVFLVALPLCMGIAQASGMPPVAGIITGIVGGIVVGSIAGSPLQVSGPAAGLYVLVFDLVQQLGVGMVGIIVLLAGVLQLAAGGLKLGQWFRAVSPAVIQGMLAGIGVLILASQVYVMLDKTSKGSGLDRLLGIPAAISDAISTGGPSLIAGLIGLATIGTIVLWSAFAPKKLKPIPGPLVGTIVAIALAAFLKAPILYVTVPDNIWSVVSPPTATQVGGLFSDMAMLKAVLVGAFSIALIASAETLLCATAVDQMHSGPRTKYDQELFAQGVGNTICGILGVLPMTGVIVRSSANVAAGAVTRRSAILHGVWLLVFASFFVDALRWIPSSALAAILVYTGYKLAYPKVIWALHKFGWAEVAIYAITVLTIVFSNLLDGVLVGLLLSLLKLVYAFSHLEVRQEPGPDNGVDLHLKGSATLVRLPKLAAELERLKPGSKVRVFIEELDYIDHACIDLLTNWDKQNRASGGALEIEWEGLTNRYQKRSGTAAERASAGAPTAPEMAK